MPISKKTPLQVAIKTEKPVKAEIKSEQSEAAPSEACVYTTDLVKLECTKHHELGNDTASLEAGPEGFLIARFGELVHTTELANLLLAPAANAKAKVAAAKAKAASKAVKPRPAACTSAVAMKRPAASTSVVADGAAASSSAEAAGANNYAILWYKNGHRFGIREKFGGLHQIFGVGGDNAGRPRMSCMR